MATLATVAAMLTIDKLGRKPPLLTGIAGVGLMLALSGALLAAQHVSPVLLIVVFAVYVACFNFSYGPICWVIVSEIFPTAIRGRAMSISIFSLWLGCSLVTHTFPGLWRSLGPHKHVLAVRPDNPPGVSVGSLPRPRDERQVVGTNRKVLGSLGSEKPSQDGKTMPCPTSP